MCLVHGVNGVRGEPAVCPAAGGLEQEADHVSTILMFVKVLLIKFSIVYNKHIANLPPRKLSLCHQCLALGVGGVSGEYVVFLVAWVVKSEAEAARSILSLARLVREQKLNHRPVYSKSVNPAQVNFPLNMDRGANGKNGGSVVFPAAGV